MVHVLILKAPGLQFGKDATLNCHTRDQGYTGLAEMVGLYQELALG